MLEKKDEKTIENIVKKVSIKVVGEALEQIVIPQFDKIYKKLEDHDKEFSEVHNSLNRIELKLNNEVKRNDEQGIKIEKLNTRVLKLAKSKA